MLQTANTKTRKEILDFIRTNRARTRDVAIWMGVELSKAEMVLSALRIGGVITRVSEHFPWDIVGEERPTCLTKLLAPIRGPRDANDDELVEFIQKYAPLTVDVATWLHASFPCAVSRLESLRARGIISRIRRKSPWRVRLKDEPITPQILDDEQDIVGRLMFTHDDEGKLLIKVRPKSSNLPLNTEETIAILKATE